MTSKTLTFAVAIGLILCSEIARGGAVPTLFRGATVLTMNAENEVLRDRDVTVRDGVIWQVAPSGENPAPDGARVIDATGMFLVPGLSDLHVHLQNEAELFLYLAHGVTTVFDLSGSPETLELRRAVAAGEIVGPQIFTTGPTLGGDPPLNPRFVHLRNGDEARSAVERAKRDGYDAIKVYSGILPEAYTAATLRARELGMPAFGHVPWALRAAGTLKPGTLAAVAHAEELFAGFYSPTSRYVSSDHDWVPSPSDLARTPELVELMRETGTSLIVNGRFLDRIVEQAEDLESVLSEPQVSFLPALQQLEWMHSRYARAEKPERSLRRGRAQSDFVPQFVEKLAEAEIPLLVGSDASVPGAAPGYSAVMEIAYLEQRCGLSPQAALGAATREVRRFFERHLPWAPPFGEVRPGFRADLMLLRSDPRAGTEEALLTRAGVMAAGSWHPADELDAELARRSRENRALAGLLVGALEGFESENPDASAAVLTRVLGEFPTAREDVEGLLIEAGSHLAGTDPGSDFAEAWARMAAKQIPDSTDLGLLLIETLIERDQRAEARELLLSLLASDPGNERATRRLEELGPAS